MPGLMILVAGPYRSGTRDDPERCDAVLRIGGPSAGADEMVATARALGLRVFTDLGEVPDAA